MADALPRCEALAAGVAAGLPLRVSAALQLSLELSPLPRTATPPAAA